MDSLAPVSPKLIYLSMLFICQLSGAALQHWLVDEGITWTYIRSFDQSGAEKVKLGSVCKVWSADYTGTRFVMISNTISVGWELFH